MVEKDSIIRIVTCHIMEVYKYLVNDSMVMKHIDKRNNTKDIKFNSFLNVVT